MENDFQFFIIAFGHIFVKNIIEQKPFDITKIIKLINKQWTENPVVRFSEMTKL